MATSIRHRRIVASLNLNGLGIEYGPLNRCIVAKAVHQVRYVDFADRATLVEHYANNPNIDVTGIPEIDIVTGGHPISHFVEANSLDYVVASHVWEHVPDFIGWLESNLVVLKQGGRLAVAYPDKRYTFDIRRRSTSLSEVVAAYVEGRTRPSFTQLADHFLNVAHVAPANVWSGAATKENVEPVHAQDHAIKLLRQFSKEDRYIDCHCWIFEDHEFLRILEDIKPFTGQRFAMLSFLPTMTNLNEFYVTLEKL